MGFFCTVNACLWIEFKTLAFFLLKYNLFMSANF